MKSAMRLPGRVYLVFTGVSRKTYRNNNPVRTSYSLTLALLLAGFALCGGSAKAQTTVGSGGPNDTAADNHAAYNRNMLYAEVGGVAGSLSINYERRLSSRWSIRLGGTRHRIRFFGEPAEAIGPVFGAHYRFFSLSSDLHAEVGAAAHPFYARATYECFLWCSIEEQERQGKLYKEGMGVFASPSVGLRAQRARGGLVLRLAATPQIGIGVKHGKLTATPSYGVSLGWGF